MQEPVSSGNNSGTNQNEARRKATSTKQSNYNTMHLFGNTIRISTNAHGLHTEGL